jgi:methyltransferase family protein
MKEVIKRIPIVRDVVNAIHPGFPAARNAASRAFPGSAAYWETRYASGGNSGVGSYTKFAEFKAEVINDFVTAHDLQTVIEFGCGDGNQLLLARYPSYIGFDVSATAISQCRGLFKADRHKSFRLMSEYRGDSADLALSLDVIYHLVEDGVFENYMRKLFQASKRYAIIYASDSDDNRDNEVMHIRHRKFTKWIELKLPAWRLVEHIPNRYPYRGDYQKGSFADFFVYENIES